MVKNNYNFQKLTPIKNVDLNVYNDALDFVFKNDDIRNIAISGAYSSGKSSVIETYKNKHGEICFMNISLAHFESTESNTTTTQNIEAVLEGKIINQLIHQIDPEKIPQTNFKVKQKASTFEIATSATFITIFVIFAMYIGDFKDWCQFVSILSVEWLKNYLLWTTNSAWLLPSGIVCTFFFGLALYSIIKIQKNKNIFKKVKLQGNEIEIFEESDESYFDKYLNEVLYLFENSDAHVIVFEDMDRYDVTRIFEKLREINTLVNNKRKRPIRFFYLLRDDIFVSKDRTKFFDFILPIVPVIDGSNSYDQFIEHFKQEGTFQKIDENFLQGLSLYVDDMRMLKNIYNEFVIYHNRIHSTEPNSNKLLAMIAYKNIFPKDFNELQLGMGFVHALFESKPEIIKQTVEKINMEIEKKQEKLRLAKNELLASIEELDSVFLLLNHNIHSVAGRNVSEFKTRAQLVKAIKNNSANATIYNPARGNPEINITSEFTKLSQNPDYIERKEAIERKTGDQIEQLEAEIQKLNNNKLIAHNNRLKELIHKENIEIIFNVKFTNQIGQENNFEEIRASQYFPLIKYLVRNGYIDETYPDYMTYFYENSLSRIDKIFLRSIADETPKEYSYSLQNPQLVLSRLNVVDFDHEEILNIDLLSYLLKTKQRNTVYLVRFLQQLEKTKNYKFIGEFLQSQIETGVFTETINQLWPSILKCIITESDFSYAQKKQYVINTLYWSPEADIRALNESNCLTTFISEDPNFLAIDTPDVDKIIEGFTTLDVCFTSIDFSTSNKKLFYAVYKNRQYQLTFALISLMLEKVYKLAKSDDFKTKNYTLISTMPDESLALYVNENINHYVGIIIENCEKHINDEEPAVLKILNSTEIDIDNKRQYISLLQTVVECISDVVNVELWSLLLQHQLVKYSEDNILDYFFQNGQGLDSFLIEFINNNSDKLSFNYKSIVNKYGEENKSKFVKAIVTCNQLLNERYKTIFSSLKLVYDYFSYQEVEVEKIKILIEIGVIRMTAENLAFIRENYPDQLVLFITKNIVKYNKEVINEENFDIDEMLLIIDGDVDDKFKIDLLKFTTNRISIQNKRYSDTVKLHILEHNLDEKDIPFLFKTFQQESDDVNKMIEYITIKHITEIIALEYVIPFELLSKLFVGTRLATETKMELFVLCLPNMNTKQAKEYLQILGMSKFLSLFNLGRPKFENNIANKKILDIFKEKKWIKGYDVDKDDPNFYRANGRKIFGDVIT